MTISRKRLGEWVDYIKREMDANTCPKAVEKMLNTFGSVVEPEGMIDGLTQGVWMAGEDKIHGPIPTYCNDELLMDVYGSWEDAVLAAGAKKLAETGVELWRALIKNQSIYPHQAQGKAFHEALINCGVAEDKLEENHANNERGTR